MAPLPSRFATSTSPPNSGRTTSGTTWGKNQMKIAGEGRPSPAHPAIEATRGQPAPGERIDAGTARLVRGNRQGLTDVQRGAGHRDDHGAERRRDHETERRRVHHHPVRVLDGDRHVVVPGPGRDARQGEVARGTAAHREAVPGIARGKAGTVRSRCGKGRALPTS